MQVNQIAAAAFIMAELCLADMAHAERQKIYATQWHCCPGTPGCVPVCQEACVMGGHTDLPPPSDCKPCTKPMAGYDDWAFCCGKPVHVVLEPRCRPLEVCPVPAPPTQVSTRD